MRRRPVLQDWQVLLLFTAGTFILYGSILRTGFLTDDYASLYRISIARNIIEKGFFRPLIDISFGFNYLLGGLHPLGYHLFNFAIHIGCCYGVYKLAGELTFFADRRREWAALLAGILFLFYPFHNEPVVWLSGRLSSMATLCALGAVYLRLRRPGHFLLPAVLFFIGLLAYESILVLPLIIVMLEWKRGDGVRRLVIVLVPWGLVGVTYMLIRYWVAGVFFSGYSGGVLARGEGGGYGVRLLKAVGRCFLPPAESSRVMTGVFVALCLVALAVHVGLWVRRDRLLPWLQQYVRVVGCWAVSMLPAVAFGVSTHTSEGDRLLYFPSVWFCMILGAGMFRFVSRRVLRWGMVVLLAAGGWTLIFGNNRHWVFASRAADSILDSMRRVPPFEEVALINLPDEEEGAFIFRNNFDKALLINGVNPRWIVVHNYFMRSDQLRLGLEKPYVRNTDSGWFIAPSTSIVPAADRWYLLRNLQKGDSVEAIGVSCRMFYWDGSRLQSLNLH